MIICSAVKPAGCECWGWREMLNRSILANGKISPRHLQNAADAERDWQIVAECQGTETQHIKGLKSTEDVDEWLAGTRRIAWLKRTGQAQRP